MTTKEQYIESLKSGWKLAGKLKSKCKSKLTIEVASAGLCLSLAAADDDVEQARDAVKKLLLIYWRHNFNKTASDEPVSIAITTEVSTNAFALTDMLESECEGQHAAAVMWAGLLLAVGAAHIEKGEGEQKIGLGGLLHLLQRATADRSRLTHLFRRPAALLTSIIGGERSRQQRQPPEAHREDAARFLRIVRDENRQ